MNMRHENMSLPWEYFHYYCIDLNKYAILWAWTWNRSACIFFEWLGLTEFEAFHGLPGRSNSPVKVLFGQNQGVACTSQGKLAHSADHDIYILALYWRCILRGLKMLACHGSEFLVKKIQNCGTSQLPRCCLSCQISHQLQSCHWLLTMIP